MLKWRLTVIRGRKNEDEQEEEKVKTQQKVIRK